jgi:hypothetical protein
METRRGFLLPLPALTGSSASGEWKEERQRPQIGHILRVVPMCGSASGQGGRLLLLLPGPIHGPDARRQGITGNVVFFSPFAVRGLCSPSCLSVLSILPPLQTRVFKKERKRSGHGMQAQHHGSLRRDRSNHSDTALVSFTPPWISQATGTHCSSLAL